jgi:pimeloyl-ACP methyl ester carboxylesterase
MTKAPINLAEYIVPLNMNGMEGRMLRLPAPKNRQREILLIYGHHASIERMAGLAEELNKYGAVTLPDLPGLGGMDTFYSIGKKPTLDDMADYLAAFVNMRYRKRRVSIFAMSFGFLVVARMLQKYPEIAKKVDILVSIVGFAHKDDFVFSKINYYLMRYGCTILSMRLPSWLTRTFILRGPFIRGAYLLVADRHTKLKDGDKAERKKRIDFEVKLWKMNDVRTYADNAITMFTANLCDTKIDLPVWHVAVEPDRYFNNHYVEQHLRIIFNDVIVMHSNMAGHAPTVVASAKDAAPFVPNKIRRELSKK